MNQDNGRKRHLWLDLEDTIITPVVEGWGNVGLINLEKIRAMIRAFEPDFVHIFSFAIHNDFDKRMFQAWVQPRIEKQLSKTLGFVPTVDGEIIPQLCDAFKIGRGHVDLMEMNCWWGKQIAFREFIRHHYRFNSTHVTVMLLDDVVYNENFEFLDLNVKGRIINIDNLKYDGKDYPILGAEERGLPDSAE